MIRPLTEDVLVVERPDWHPHVCIASMRAEDPDGFIDTGLTPTFIDPRVYISVSWVREHAQKLGFYDPEAREEADELKRKVALLEEQVREADKFAEAAEYTLGRFGQRVQNKPGRKPKTTRSSEEA